MLIYAEVCFMKQGRNDFSSVSLRTVIHNYPSGDSVKLTWIAR